MTEQQEITIKKVFSTLSDRYNRISVSTINGLLKGKIVAKQSRVDISLDKNTSPNIDEAEAAFLKYTCVIFTAFRGGYTLDENVARNQCLKLDMEELGLTYRPVTGCYREADWEYANIEYCYFVYDIEGKDNLGFFQKTYSLSSKYEQDSFLYKRAGINRTAFLVATNDNGRREFRGDIRFAGQLFLHVPDVEAWTDCSDGRFAFQLKGMILTSTGQKNLKLGEGNLFDVCSYDADALVVIQRSEQSEISSACKGFSLVPLYRHVFVKEQQRPEAVREELIRLLNKAKAERHKVIGVYCSAIIDGSYVEGARVALETIRTWLSKNEKRIRSVVIVDTYGDYAKAISRESGAN